MIDMKDPQMAITDEEFDKMLDQELSIIKRIPELHHKDFMPTLTVALRKGFYDDLTFDIVGFPEFDHDNKHEVMQKTGQMFLSKRAEDGWPVAIVLTVEANYLTVPKEEQQAFEKAIAEGKRVSEYAKAKECFSTFGLTIDGRKFSAMHNIKRNKKGEFSELNLTHYVPVTSNQTNLESGLLNQFYIGMLKVLKGAK